MNKTSMFFITFFMIFFGFLGYTATQRIRQEDKILLERGKIYPLQTGSLFISSHPLPSIAFITDNNHSWISCENSDKKWSLFFFGYAQCPAFCPEILSQMDQIGRIIKSQTMNYYFVSIDPDRDTPEAMHNFLKKFHTPIIGLTGSELSTHSLANFFKLHVESSSGQEEHIEHAAVLALIGPDGSTCAILRDLESPARCAQDILYVQNAIA